MHDRERLLANMRKGKREATRLSARISTLDPVEPANREGAPYFVLAVATTVDVAEGGVGLRSDCGFEAGQRVVVELELPDAQVVERRGRVVWATLDESGVERLGVEFEENVAAIVALLRLNRPS
jgi:hypothetical protein